MNINNHYIVSLLAFLGLFRFLFIFCGCCSASSSSDCTSSILGLVFLWAWLVVRRSSSSSSLSLSPNYLISALLPFDVVEDMDELLVAPRHSDSRNCHKARTSLHFLIVYFSRSARKAFWQTFPDHS